MRAPVLAVRGSDVLARSGDGEAASRAVARMVEAAKAPGAEGGLVASRDFVVVADADDITPALGAWMTGGVA